MTLKKLLLKYGIQITIDYQQFILFSDVKYIIYKIINYNSDYYDDILINNQFITHLNLQDTNDIMIVCEHSNNKKLFNILHLLNDYIIDVTSLNKIYRKIYKNEGAETITKNYDVDFSGNEYINNKTVSSNYNDQIDILKNIGDIYNKVKIKSDDVFKKFLKIVEGVEIKKWGF